MISKDNMGKYNDLIAEAKRIRLDKTITDEKIRTGKLEKIQKKIEKLVEFKPNNYDDAYANSREMQHDVVEENKMRFFTGGFGDASENIDYTGHPLLDKTEFKTTPIEVIDNGKLLENAFGEPLRVSRELTYNDVFRVVHDYIAHAGTAATFGAKGEERAWAAHVSRIIADTNFTTKEKIEAIHALTSETRGQNTWVNNINDYNREYRNKLLELRNEAANKGDTKTEGLINQVLNKSEYHKFATQKVGLLPHDAMIGDYEETKANDDWIKENTKEYKYQ